MHVEFLAKIWGEDLGLAHLKSTTLESCIKQNIRRPHVAVFHESEEFPVGWMMLYSDGSAGQMHVITTHRRKGLGRLIARKMYSIVKEAHGLGPSLSINVKNHTSAKLFSTEGWVRQKRPYKMYLWAK